MRLATLVLFTLLALTTIANADARRYAPGEIRVGQRVRTDPSQIHQWQNCTVTAINMQINAPREIDTYTVVCDPHDGYRSTYTVIADTAHILPGGAAAKGGAVHHKPPTDIARGSAGGAFKNGTYHCLIGYRVMLTYGDFVISGNHYTFHPGDGGPTTSGTYGLNGDGSMAWHGDYGVINRPPAHVFEAGKEAYVPNSFYFRYRPKPGGTDETMSCRIR